MKRYVDFIKANRKKLFIFLIILNILALIGITKIEIYASFDIFKVDDSEYQEALTGMEEIFGGSNQIILLVETDRDNLISSFDEVGDILNDEGVTDFTSPLMLLDLVDTSKFDNLESAYETLGGLSPVVYRDKKTFGTFTLDVSEGFSTASLEKKLDESNITYYMSGNPYMQSQILKLVFSILVLIPPLALLLVLLTFRSQLSSFKATMLSILPAGMAALWTLGLVGWFGGKVSIITVLAPIFSIVIGSADGLHFISHIEEEVGRGKSNIDGLTHTLSIIGLPIVITTTTSVAGFAGLLLINTEAIRDLATFASLGVFLAGLITWYVLPLILTGDIKLIYKEKLQSSTYIKKLWGKKSIVIGISLVALASIFIPKIKTEFNQLMFFREFTTVQKNFIKIVEVNDGAIPLYYFGSTTLDDKDKTLQALSEFSSDLSSDENVAKIINPTSLAANIKSPSLDLLSKAKNFMRIHDGKIYYRLVVFPKDLNNDTIDNIESISQKHNDKTNGQLIGMQFLMREMNTSMVIGQIRSIIFTLVLIFIMLLLSLKSLKLAIFSSLPIILTSIILYGFLGFTGISLNLITCTIFSITLGIGVDYAIHYTSVYRYYKNLGEDNPSVLALKYTSRPIIANALGLSLGLSALWLSPLLIHPQISLLMWVSMSVSVFMSLTLLPTLLNYKGS